MSQRRRQKRGNPVHGWVALDKPVGMTSTQAVSLVKRLFQAQKAGHSGTLDPLASGVLPIALGEATKTVPYVMEAEKAYRFTVRWGVETTTDDTEGTPVQTSQERPTRAAIEALLGRYTGTIMQVPPAFSAIKVDGERAYDLARDGETVDLPAREVTIERLVLEDLPDTDSAVFVAECGKGTYVRALARDFGRDLGCFGHVTDLRRTRVGRFADGALATPDDLRAAAEDGSIAGYLLACDTALDALAEIAVHPGDAGRIRRGMAILLRGAGVPVLSEEPVYATAAGELVAIGVIEQGRFQPKRIFNLA
ncbi:MAG: tRNA pseudouridine(55) synthase TruB [Hyphomicrobiaceae bacterium]|nr:tRNA pseudouridine(55) synthase TruB [Hyphomicrobiaceae bacterium]